MFSFPRLRMQTSIQPPVVVKDPPRAEVLHRIYRKMVDLSMILAIGYQLLAFG
jgi:hypothetical protein